MNADGCICPTQVRVAEFQYEAVRCTVSGSGFPGLARQRQLAGLTAGLDTTATQASPLWGKAETGRLPTGLVRTGKGGAGKHKASGAECILGTVSQCGKQCCRHWPMRCLFEMSCWQLDCLLLLLLADVLLHRRCASMQVIDTGFKHELAKQTGAASLQSH